MNILVLNCGSSSLKYQLINMDDESAIWHMVTGWMIKRKRNSGLDILRLRKAFTSRFLQTRLRL